MSNHGEETLSHACDEAFRGPSWDPLERPFSPKIFVSKELANVEVGSASTTSITRSKKYDRRGVLVRDSIIGFADGLTVPFALTAGLSSLGSSKVVILGGLAELFAGSISMGLGAYLAAITERKHYEVEEKRERQEVRHCPKAEEKEVFGIFEQYGISKEAAKSVVDGLRMDEVHDGLWTEAVQAFRHDGATRGTGHGRVLFPWRPPAYGALLCHPHCQPCAVRLRRHHYSRADDIRLYEGTHNRYYPSRCSLECVADLDSRYFGSSRVLRNRARYERVQDGLK